MKEIVYPVYVPNEVGSVFVDAAFARGEIGISTLAQSAIDKAFQYPRAATARPHETFDNTHYERFMLRTVYLRADQLEKVNALAEEVALKPDDVIVKAMAYAVANNTVAGPKL